MKTQQLQLCSKKQSRLLRDVGFDWKTEYITIDDDVTNVAMLIGDASMAPNYIAVPTVALALKWLRDVKGLNGFCQNNYYGWYFEIHSIGRDLLHIDGNTDLSLFFKTYEEVEIALVDKLLSIVEKGVKLGDEIIKL